MERGWAVLLTVALSCAGLAAAQPAAAPGAVPSPGLPRVTLSLTNPALGQPAPAPGFFEGLASGLLRSARQAAGSFIPVMNLIPDRGSPANSPPPALPPSLLPQSGNRFSQAPRAALPASSNAGGQLAENRGQAPSPGSPVLPGGIIPLRASQAEPMTVLHRTPLSLTAKAEALRAPLRSLEHLSAIPSEAGAERASRAGRQISEIVTDDGASGASGGAMAIPGPEAGQAMGDAELDSLRDAVAALPAPASPGAPAANATPLGGGGGALPRAAAAKATLGLGEAEDAASTYDGQAAAPAANAFPYGARDGARPRAAVPRLDMSLLVLHVFESAVRFSRAEEEALARRLRALGFGAAAEPARAAVRLVGPPAPPPIYALGSRGPAAGPGTETASQAWSAESPRPASGERSGGAFDLPDSSGLPRRVPGALAMSLLLPLVGVALFFSSELRR